MRRASPGLSSTSPIRSIVALTSFPRRELDDREPEGLDRLYHLDKLLYRQRLRDVAVRMEGVRLHDVLLRLRGGKNDHRDPLQILVLLDLLQDFATILSRQLEVEHDEVGTGRVCMLALATQA